MLTEKEDQPIKELANPLLYVPETFNTMVYGMLNNVEHAEHVNKDGLSDKTDLDAIE